MQNGDTIQLASKTKSARGLSVKFNNQPSMGNEYNIIFCIIMKCVLLLMIMFLRWPVYTCLGILSSFVVVHSFLLNSTRRIQLDLCLYRYNISHTRGRQLAISNYIGYPFFCTSIKFIIFMVDELL